MAWTYLSGVLTSTGGTEAAPDSLLAGIDIVEAVAPTLAYRDGFVAWLNNVEVRYGGSAVIIDDDSCISMRGSSYLRPVNSAGATTAVTIIHGNRSVFQNAGTTARIDTVISFPAGSTVICRRQNPKDPSPRIRHMGTVRNDYFSVAAGINLSKVDIAGVDIYLTSGQNFFKAYLTRNGGTVNIVQYKDVSVFGAINPQFFNSTYRTWYLETLNLSSEAITGVFTMDRPTYYLASPTSFSGDFRSAEAYIVNPTFLNNCWNGGVNFVASGLAATSKLFLQYSYTNTFKQGFTNLQDVRVRFTRARQSVNGSPTWTAPNTTITATSNGSGQYTAVNLLDAYREGTSTTNLERFNWTAKARKYDKRTAGETLFANRVLFQHSVNMSAGYNEEVQMLRVPYITITESEALALTGTSFAPSGTTGGVITLSENHTVAELWQVYRAWISQLANFDTEDTWSYDGTTLNIGSWTIVGLQYLMGGAITTSTATAVGGFSNVVINGSVVQSVPTDLDGVTITGTLTYNTNTDITITITDTVINTVQNLGTGIITINKVNSSIANYTDAEINFIDSTISVIGADTVTFHPTANDRDLNINVSGTFSSSYAFKYGSTINGSLMSGTLYLRCVAGGVPFNVDKAIVLGYNVVDLGVTAQLLTLNSKIDLTAKETTTQNKLNLLNSNLFIMNENIKKTSLFTPATNNISI